MMKCHLPWCSCILLWQTVSMSPRTSGTLAAPLALHLGPSPPHYSSTHSQYSLSTAQLLSIKAGARRSCHSYTPSPTLNFYMNRECPRRSYSLIPVTRKHRETMEWVGSCSYLLESRLLHPRTVLWSVFSSFFNSVFSLGYLVLPWTSRHQCPLFLVCQLPLVLTVLDIFICLFCACPSVPVPCMALIKHKDFIFQPWSFLQFDYQYLSLALGLTSSTSILLFPLLALLGLTRWPLIHTVHIEPAKSMTRFFYFHVIMFKC